MNIGYVFVQLVGQLFSQYPALFKREANSGSEVIKEYLAVSVFFWNMPACKLEYGTVKASRCDQSGDIFPRGRLEAIRPDAAAVAIH